MPTRGCTTTSPRRRSPSWESTSTRWVSSERGHTATRRTWSTAATRPPSAALGLPPADVVVAGEVIEHLDDCGPFLDGLHALVQPGGLLALSTPNGASLTNAVAALANLEVNHPDHVTSFTSHTLDTLLGRHGWIPVQHAVFTYQVKSQADGTLRSRVLVSGARGVLAVERMLAKLGRPFLAGGLLVVARAQG